MQRPQGYPVMRRTDYASRSDAAFSNDVLFGLSECPNDFAAGAGLRLIESAASILDVLKRTSLGRHHQLPHPARDQRHRPASVAEHVLSAAPGAP